MNTSDNTTSEESKATASLSESNALAQSNTNIPFWELTQYHQQLQEKYKDTQPADNVINPDTTDLITFNGYYALNTAPGAFFAIDTNMHMVSGATAPIYDVAFLLSLDGKTSARFAYTGTFDGTQLIQKDKDGFSIDLLLTHTDGSDETTALCAGFITLPHQAPAAVSGSTYNNPIPYSLYIGDYYVMPTPNSVQQKPVKVMRIKDQYQIFYDGGKNDGILQPVPSYTYNMNMYFFTFQQEDLTVQLIMGTASAKGFACNNMTADAKQNLTTRALQTVVAPDMAPMGLANINSNVLAQQSGYYQLPSIGPKAFLSIQAQYVNAIIADMYVVMISISMDGVTSKGYYFDDTMTFTDNTLSMPNQSVSLTFNREYDAAQGSLATITGSINAQVVNGFTYLNPVPLSVFGGVPMTNPQGTSLTVVSDNEVTYGGQNFTTDMVNILYVPLMYILAYPAENPTIVMSFGTNGLQGNACIITDNNAIYTVDAIPKSQTKP